jgi:spore germination cell wall hydrolase CwlJ-like protein
MKLNFKSILSLSIIVAFIISPFIAVNFDHREEDKNIEVKDINIKQKEVPKKKEDDIETTEVPKKETKKKELKPTLNTNRKTVKQVKKVAKKEQMVKKNKQKFYLSSRERKVVECIVMGESGSEPYKGQLMVAYCILNACKKDGLQPSEVRKVYKYSGWNTNPTKSVKRAVSSIFDDGHKPVNDTPLYFYAPKYCNSTWHETQRYICTVGGHKFFGRW